MSGVVEIIFGCGGVGNPEGSYATESAVNEVLDVLEADGVKKLDTAQVYGSSEEYLGKVGAASRFAIDTKVGGGLKPGSATKEGVGAASRESLQKLKTDKVDVYYIHAPDHKVSLEETLAAIQEAYKAGRFTRFGLSNYLVEDVRKVYNHCKEKGYVLPTVYQGNYNAVARIPDTTLIPTLRELGIAFYAYSPIAGGFLTKSKQQIANKEGRFDPSNFIGKMYSSLYGGQSLLDALSKWESIADKAGCSKGELAYRWVMYNSPLNAKYGDGVIIGARNVSQLKETLKWLKNGPLDSATVTAIDEIWQGVKDEAPIDNYNSHFASL